MKMVKFCEKYRGVVANSRETCLGSTYERQDKYIEKQYGKNDEVEIVKRSQKIR